MIFFSIYLILLKILLERKDMSKLSIANYLIHNFSALGGNVINEEKIRRTVDVLVHAWDNDQYLMLRPRSVRSKSKNIIL